MAELGLEPRAAGNLALSHELQVITYYLTHPLLGAIDTTLPQAVSTLLQPAILNSLPCNSYLPFPFDPTGKDMVAEGEAHELLVATEALANAPGSDRHHDLASSQRVTAPLTSYKAKTLKRFPQILPAPLPKRGRSTGSVAWELARVTASPGPSDTCRIFVHILKFAMCWPATPTSSRRKKWKQPGK